MTTGNAEGWESPSLQAAMNFLTVSITDHLSGCGPINNSEEMDLRAEGAGMALVALRDLSPMRIDRADPIPDLDNRWLNPPEPRTDDEVREHTRRLRVVTDTIGTYLIQGIVAPSFEWTQHFFGFRSVLSLLATIDDDGLPHPLDLDDQFLNLLAKGIDL